ncbi:DUF6615 family protein [Priestia megaterium]|uniref:DUF6615 family protein n=1 Tax=Priestia megaterium TaxID=1404 RepID=UPI003179650D
MNFCQLLKHETEKIYQTLKVAQELEIDIQEETLTELMLIDLKLQSQQLGLNTTIVHCNKHTESRTGTDFLWFIGSKKYNSYIAFYIQAKKYSHEKYKLKHTYKKPKHGNIYDQAKNLIYNAKNAAGFEAIPVYCFYNLLDDKTLLESSYLKKFPHLDIRKEEFSFTYASAYHVESLLSKVHQTRKEKDGLKKKNICRAHFSFEEVQGLPIHTLFYKTTKYGLAHDIGWNFVDSHTTLYEGRNHTLHYLVNDYKYALPSYIKELLDEEKNNNKTEEDINEEEIMDEGVSLDVFKYLPHHIIISSED